MVLTDGEREKLHNAMVEYLTTHGFNDAANSVKSSIDAHGGGAYADKDSALERKWGMVLRLTRKNQELDKKVTTLENEVRDLRDPTKNIGGGDGKGMADLPLAPAEPSIHTFAGHRDTLTAVALHPHDPIGFSSSEDGTIRVWNLETRRHIKILREHTDTISDIAVEPVEGKMMASAGKDMSVKVYDLDSGDDYNCVSTLHHNDSVSTVKWDPEAINQLVTATRSGEICVWDATRGAQLMNIQHGTWIHSLCVSGGQIVIGDHQEVVALYSQSTKQQVRSFHEHENVVDVVCFSHEKADAVWIEHHGTPDQKTFLKDLLRRREVRRSAQEAGIETGDAANNGGGGGEERYQPRFIVSGGRDKNVIMRDATSGTVALKFEGHENWVQGITFTPSGKHLVTCADDGFVLVLDLATRRVSRKIEAHDHFVSCLCLHPHGKPLMLTGSADTTVKMWPCK